MTPNLLICIPKVHNNCEFGWLLCSWGEFYILSGREVTGRQKAILSSECCWRIHVCKSLWSWNSCDPAAPEYNAGLHRSPANEWHNCAVTSVVYPAYAHRPFGQTVSIPSADWWANTAARHVRLRTARFLVEQLAATQTIGINKTQHGPMLDVGRGNDDLLLLFLV